MKSLKEILLASVKELLKQYKAGKIDPSDKLTFSMRELDLLFAEENQDAKAQ